MTQLIAIREPPLPPDHVRIGNDVYKLSFKSGRTLSPEQWADLRGDYENLISQVNRYYPTVAPGAAKIELRFNAKQEVSDIEIRKNSTDVTPTPLGNIAVVQPQLDALNSTYQKIHRAAMGSSSAPSFRAFSPSSHRAPPLSSTHSCCHFSSSSYPDCPRDRPSSLPPSRRPSFAGSASARELHLPSHSNPFESDNAQQSVLSSSLAAAPAEFISVIDHTGNQAQFLCNEDSLNSGDKGFSPEELRFAYYANVAKSQPSASSSVAAAADAPSRSNTPKSNFQWLVDLEKAKNSETPFTTSHALKLRVKANLMSINEKEQQREIARIIRDNDPSFQPSVLSVENPDKSFIDAYAVHIYNHEDSIPPQALFTLIFHPHLKLPLMITASDLPNVRNHAQSQQFSVDALVAHKEVQPPPVLHSTVNAAPESTAIANKKAENLQSLATAQPLFTDERTEAALSMRQPRVDKITWLSSMKDARSHREAVEKPQSGARR